ncbi:MAG: hypothetical protein ACK5JH_13760 [Anaerocolumna sp.]
MQSKKYKAIIFYVSQRIQFSEIIFIIAVNILFIIISFKNFTFEGLISTANMVEWIIWNLNDMNYIITVCSFSYLYLCYKISLCTGQFHLLILKFDSRTQWVYTVIFAFFSLAIIYILLLLFILIVFAIGKVQQGFWWSDISIYLMNDIYKLKKYNSILVLLVRNICNIILYYLTIGLSYYTLYLVLKNSKISFSILLIRIFIDFGIIKSMIHSLYKYTYLGNIILNINQYNLNIGINYIFWGINILLNIIIIHIITYKIDFTLFKK